MRQQSGVSRVVGLTFVDICFITPESTPENNPYLEALKSLFPLIELGTPDMKNFANYMAFMGRLTDRLHKLLLERDTAALLIIVHWFALVYQLDVWWFRARAHRESSAIVTFLGRKEDPRIWRMLTNPVQVMGLEANFTTELDAQSCHST